MHDRMEVSFFTFAKMQFLFSVPGPSLVGNNELMSLKLCFRQELITLKA